MKPIELAGVVIYDEEGKLLLLHRNTPDLIQWELPGGKVESDETREEAARREAKEEIGVSVRIVRALGDASFEHKGLVWRYTWYEAEIREGEVPSVEEPETFDEVKYRAVSELVKVKDQLSPNVINLLGFIAKREF